MILSNNQLLAWFLEWKVKSVDAKSIEAAIDEFWALGRDKVYIRLMAGYPSFQEFVTIKGLSL